MENRVKKLEDRVLTLESAVELLMRELAAVTSELIGGRVLEDEAYCESCGKKLINGEGYLWADGVRTCEDCGGPTLEEFIDHEK